MIDEKTTTPLWQKLLLIVGGIVAAFGLAFLLLALVPDLRPDPLREERNRASMTIDVEFRLSDGDLLFHIPNQIKPIPPEEDMLLSAHTLSWDENSFRLPAMLADSYPIAAFGDSFTEGANVAMPWSDLLAAELDTPVYNYGYSGYGPFEIAITIEDFINVEPRTWMLYAYYGGNDLMDVNRGLDAKLMESSPFNVIPWLMDRAQQTADLQRRADPPEDGKYNYPVPVIIGGNYYDMAFLDYVLWWQRFPPEGIEHTATYAEMRGLFFRMDEAVPAETCRALIFIPPREQLYYPYILYPQWMNDIALSVVAPEGGKIGMKGERLAPEDQAEFLENLTAHRDTVQRLADDLGWHFIDLLDPFTERVAQGELLYHRYDGHWNQAGHELAAQIIADYMRNVPDCPLQ